jgi:hypothetical protein
MQDDLNCLPFGTRTYPHAAMPSDENTDAPDGASRKRPGALQLGPRKKPYVPCVLFSPQYRFNKGFYQV